MFHLILHITSWTSNLKNTVAEIQWYLEKDSSKFDNLCKETKIFELNKMFVYRMYGLKVTIFIYFEIQLIIISMMVVHLSIFWITFIIQHLLFDILIALTYINVVTSQVLVTNLDKDLF